MKLYNVIKSAVYLIAGLLVLIFNGFFPQNDGVAIPTLVGACMILFGTDGVLSVVINRTYEKDKNKFTNAVIIILLGIVMLVVLPTVERKLETTCIIWAVWSILREGEEICEKVLPYRDRKIVAVLNGVESVAVIVLAIILLAKPELRHAHLHVILLGVELILEVLWDIANEIESKLRKKSRE